VRAEEAADESRDIMFQRQAQHCNYPQTTTARTHPLPNIPPPTITYKLTHTVNRALTSVVLLYSVPIRHCDCVNSQLYKKKSPRTLQEEVPQRQSTATWCASPTPMNPLPASLLRSLLPGTFVPVRARQKQKTLACALGTTSIKNTSPTTCRVLKLAPVVFSPLPRQKTPGALSPSPKIPPSAGRRLGNG